MKKKRDYNRNEYVLFRYWAILKKKTYVSGLGVCILVALYVWMFVAGANKVEGTMSWCIRTNQILASNH